MFEVFVQYVEKYLKVHKLENPSKFQKLRVTEDLVIAYKNLFEEEVLENDKAKAKVDSLIKEHNLTTLLK
jgi:hypothetical protein